MYMRVCKLPHESRGHSERRRCSSPGRGQRPGGKAGGGGAVDTVKALAAASAPGSGRLHSFLGINFITLEVLGGGGFA